MSQYLYRHTEHFDGAMAMVDRRQSSRPLPDKPLDPPQARDLDEDYFRSLTVAKQNRECRNLALKEKTLAWQCVTDMDPAKFLAAWQEGDAIEMLRLVDEAMRDGMEEEINDQQKEYEREVYR